MNYVFFTLRDFKKIGGGSIRIYAVVNALAEKGEKVILISGAKDFTQFHAGIQHITILNIFAKKAILQGLLGVLPAFFVIKLFPRLFKNALEGLKQVDIKKSKLFFFEYLDNSVAYILKKTGRIENYVNDIHGISTIEFDYQRKKGNSFLQKLIGSVKYHLAKLHDKKIFEYADGIVYSSNAMKKYFDNLYDVEKVKPYILPNLISSNAAQQIIDVDVRNQIINELKIKEDDFVFFFAGGFKSTSGVDDLVRIFSRIHKEHQNLKLILIGNGPLKEEVEKMISQEKIQEQVILLNSIPYEKLKTYQSIANVIVCPDRFNEFSNLIIHLKYLDALVSGKIVINGSFKSVKEINPKDFLSVSFEPSDVEDLYQKLKYCITHYLQLCEKYKDTQKYASQNLTYDSFIHVLTE